MSTANKKVTGFTDEEKAAMREHVLELKAQALGEDGEKMILAKLAQMPEPDRGMGKKLHEIVRKNAPNLMPKLWYGMPAYANKEGKVVCFFQGASKFKVRYATLGFNDPAKLDEGSMWPTAFALKEWNSAVETKIASLVKQAAG
jgi:uncharacterized protein YdhG (YjbR/CyaY superfamily)